MSTLSDYDRGVRERDCKAKPEHWAIILDFLEEHSNLLQNKFEMFDGDNREKKNLWLDLANRLNSLGLGFKTPEKWQLAIGRWKSKVKAKAACKKKERAATGGGPSKLSDLSNFEERLMAITGWKSVFGDGNREIGIREQVQKENIKVDIVDTPLLSPMGTTVTPPVHLTIPQSLPIVQKIPSASTSYAVQGRKRDIDEENLQKGPPSKRRIKTSTEKSKKFVSLAKIHTETLNVLNNINDNLGNISTSLGDITSFLKDYVERNDNK